MKPPRHCKCKNLYLRPEDIEVWEKAARMFPFFLKKSVSQFCTDQVRATVARLEREYRIK